MITKATSGGAQHYVFDLATHLSSANFVVSVAYGTPGALEEQLRAHEIPLHRIDALDRNISLFSDLASFIAIIRLLRRERPYVLHLNSSKAAGLGALAGVLCQVPRIVFTAHGWPFKEDRNLLSRTLIYVGSWLTALLSHVVIVVSKTDETFGKRMWFAGKKIRYVLLAIEPPVFLPREDAAFSLQITTHAPRIITVAELTRNKGVSYAIEAMALLQKRAVNATYFIMGDGEDSVALERLAKKRGAAHRIQFLHFVPDAARYLRAFDIMLLPSLKEGMPYVLLEAAAAALPIVATNVIDPSFSEQNPAIMLVPPHDPVAIADALEQAISDRPIGVTPSPHALQNMIDATTSCYT